MTRWIVAELHRKTSYGLFLLLLGCCVGCTGLQSATAPRGAAPVGGIAPLAGLPPPSALAQLPPRATSYDPEGLVKEGAGYTDALPHNRVLRNGGNVVLGPDYPAAGSAGLAYCCYRFDAAGYSGPPQLRLTWDGVPPPAGAAWVGVGNQSRGVWDWFALPFEGEVDFTELAPHLDESGRLLAVVVLHGTDYFPLRRVRLGGLILGGELKLTPSRTFVAPQHVKLDASGLQPNGAVAQSYAWDLDGNGTYELETHAVPTTELDYPEPGQFSLGVRLTTDDGLQGTVTASLRGLRGSWELQTLADPPDPSIDWRQPRLAVIEGRAAIAYLRRQSGAPDHWTIRYIAADATQSPEGWSSAAEVVPDSAEPAVVAALRDVNGAPAICYADSAGKLWYKRASNVSGTAWAPAVQVADSATDGFAADMQVVDGQPAIDYVFYDTGGHGLAYARAADANGTGWGLPATLVPSGVSGPVPMCMADDRPAIAYSSSLGRILVADNTTGDSTWAGRPGLFPNLELSLGQMGGVMVLAGADGLSSSHPVLLWAADAYGNYPWDGGACEWLNSTAYFSVGGPCLTYSTSVCYQDTAGENLRFCGVTVDGASFSYEPQLVDNGDWVGYACNMVVVDGVPMIAYEARASSTVFAGLKFAVLR